MNNCSPWIHEIYQEIFEICTDLGILVVNAKYALKYTVAYTRFFAQCNRIIHLLTTHDMHYRLYILFVFVVTVYRAALTIVERVSVHTKAKQHEHAHIQCNSSASSQLEYVHDSV